MYDAYELSMWILAQFNLDEVIAGIKKRHWRDEQIWKITWEHIEEMKMNSDLAVIFPNMNSDMNLDFAVTKPKLLTGENVDVPKRDFLNSTHQKIDRLMFPNGIQIATFKSVGGE